MNDQTDVYPVGVLADLQRHGVRRAWRAWWRRVPRWVDNRDWRAMRNSFNGYLAEHRHGGHNCGRGWTKRAALRRVERICRDAS